MKVEQGIECHQLFRNVHCQFQPILKVTLAWAGKGRILSGFHFKHT